MVAQLFDISTGSLVRPAGFRSCLLLIAVALTSSGCSMLMTMSAVVPQPENQVWVIEQEDAIQYPFKSGGAYLMTGGIHFYGVRQTCHRFSIKMDATFVGGWDMFG